MTARFWCFAGQSGYFGGFWDGVSDSFSGYEGKRCFDLSFVREGHRKRFGAVVWAAETGPEPGPGPEPFPLG